jgi:hypothetical protein
MIIIIALIILVLAIWGFSPRKTILYYSIAKNSIEYDDRKDANRKFALNLVVSITLLTIIVAIGLYLCAIILMMAWDPMLN